MILLLTWCCHTVSDLLVCVCVCVTKQWSVFTCHTAGQSELGDVWYAVGRSNRQWDTTSRFTCVNTAVAWLGGDCRNAVTQKPGRSSTCPMENHFLVPSQAEAPPCCLIEGGAFIQDRKGTLSSPCVLYAKMCVSVKVCLRVCVHAPLTCCPYVNIYSLPARSSKPDLHPRTQMYCWFHELQTS